jgi:hypothetical protein
MSFFEKELFYDKIRNLTIYETHLSILLTESHEDIYWTDLFQ